MKRFLSLLVLILLFWVVQLRDGTVYTCVDLKSGPNGVRLIMEDKTEITFPWGMIYSITEKDWRK